MCSCSSQKSCGSQSQGCSCSCHKSQCGSQSTCSSGGCGCGSGGGKGSWHCSCDFAEKFLQLADHAWMEVLKDKIKEQIEANSEKLDELARIIAEANHERWHKKMEDKQCCGGYEEKLKGFFHQSCQTGQKNGSQQGNQSNKK